MVGESSVLFHSSRSRSQHGVMMISSGNTSDAASDFTSDSTDDFGQNSPHSIPCRYDTNGDGDCERCAGRGGCKAIGGPFFIKAVRMPIGLPIVTFPCGHRVPSGSTVSFCEICGH